MQTEHLYLFPVISNHPGQAEYFWFKLPFAIPGLVTFFIGLTLAVFGILALFNTDRKKSIQYYFSFSLNCFSIGIFGLAISLRSVILDLEVLASWNKGLYFFVLMMLPSAFHLIYYITLKKIPFIQGFAFIGWAFVLAGYYSLLDNSAFTGEWTFYVFGNYPKPGLVLKIWGIYGTLGYILVFPSLFKFFYREKSFDNPHVFIGLNLLFLLLIFNLPSFVGFTFYPAANFIFIAMGFVAYGVFRNDFLSLNGLLFKKSGIYYFQNVVLGITFLLLTFLISYGLSPNDLVNTKWYPWALIPLFSCVTIFFLSLMIAGLNPTEKSNQIAALSILCLAFYLVQAIIKSLELEPVVSLRISQIFYFLFLPAISLNIRFIYLTMGLRIPRHIIFTDITVAIICSLTFTDYMFVGYYKYYFGNSISLGFPVKILFLASIINSIFIFRDWKKSSKRNNNAILNIFILSILLSAILITLSIPASIGYEFYTFGNLQILPAGLLAIGIFKYGVLPYDRNVLKISRRFALFSIGIIPILFFIILPRVSHNAPMAESIFYTILLLSPLFLFIFLFLFVFSRPLVNQLIFLIGENNIEQRRLATVGQLASSIIHDIKNPMVSIRGFAEMASDKIFSESERAEYLRLIADEIDRLSDMVYDILDFAKGEMKLNLEEISLDEFFREIIDFLKPEFQKHSIEIRLSLEGDIKIFLDKNKFRRVIFNLLGNAKDAMISGGLLNMEISMTRMGVIIWISDTGKGIPLNLYGQLFDPFISQGKEKGTGLGLTIAKSIVEAHGGTINLLSEEGHGANVFIFLPLPETLN